MKIPFFIYLVDKYGPEFQQKLYFAGRCILDNVNAKKWMFVALGVVTNFVLNFTKLFSLTLSAIAARRSSSTRPRVDL